VITGLLAACDNRPWVLRYFGRDTLRKLSICEVGKDRPGLQLIDVYLPFNQIVDPDGTKEQTADATANLIIHCREIIAQLLNEVEELEEQLRSKG
jgi:hypothetical protein